MKNIFIAGVAKSGKSTIANKINCNNIYNHIPLDYFASSLKHKFPETKITSNVIIDRNSSKKLALLLSRVIEIINNTDELFIIDSAHILPKDIVKYLDKDKWEIYYIGYPNITKEEKLKLIRKYEKETDWTFKRDDKDLLNILDELIKLSNEIYKDCQELNIKFIDTSNDIDEVYKKLDIY